MLTLSQPLRATTSPVGKVQQGKRNLQPQPQLSSSVLLNVSLHSFSMITQRNQASASAGAAAPPTGLLSPSSSVTSQWPAGDFDKDDQRPVILFDGVCVLCNEAGKHHERKILRRRPLQKRVPTPEVSINLLRMWLCNTFGFLLTPVTCL